MKHKIRVERSDDPAIKPKCPGCRTPLEKLLSVRVDGGFFSANQSDVVVCPHCHVMLGYGKVNYF